MANTDSNTLSLEVISEFIEKEFFQVLRENYNYGAPFPITKVNILRRWEESEISIQELMKLRLNKNVPGIVYQKDNCYFYSVIPGTLNIAGKADSLGKHACSEQCTMVCQGCPRTKDLTVTYQQRTDSKHSTFKTAVMRSWRIEKYDFIREGLETFNMHEQNEAFIVLHCENYRVRLSKLELSNV